MRQRPTLLCSRSVTATMSGLPRPQSMRSSLASTKNLDPADLYIKLDRIGKGSFGEVYKGCVRRPGSRTKLCARTR